jgi:protein-S-isoprenylcysteine O-methyltransferase Ste14
MKDHFHNRGGWWVVLQSLLLLAVLSLGVAFRLTWHGFVFGWGGGVFLLLGAVCGIAGAVTLGRNLTPFPEPAAHGNLVQNGIYGWIRHPLYTAVFCGAVGWALVWRSAPAFFAALALGPFFAAKARREERFLREKFPEYVEYEQRVKRFIPWVY